MRVLILIFFLLTYPVLCYCQSSTNLKMPPEQVNGYQPEKPKPDIDKSHIDRGRGSMNSPKNDQSPPPKNIPSIIPGTSGPLVRKRPLVFGAISVAYLKEFNDAINKIEWIKRLLVGNILLNLFTDKFREQAINIDGIDWQNTMNTFNNLEIVKRRELISIVDDALFFLGEEIEKRNGQGLDTKVERQEVRFYENLGKSLEQEGAKGNNTINLQSKIDIKTSTSFKESGEKTLKIYPQGFVENGRNKSLSYAAYFFYGDGEPLEDNNGRFSSKNGQVAVLYKRPENDQKRFYINKYEDWSLEIPYKELDLSPGIYDLKYYLVVYYDSFEISRSGWRYFTASL